MGFTKAGLLKALKKIQSKEIHNDREGYTVFEDGTDAGNCTRSAKYVLRKLGLDREIWGYDWYENESAELGEAEGGHDFAVVDGRFLVDLWAMDYYDTEGVYDLEDSRDQREVKRLYGDRQKWVRLSDKDFKNIHLSYTLDQLVKKTEKPETHERAYRCKTLRIKYEPKTNRYVFLSRGSEPWSDSKGHLVSVLFDYNVDTTKKHEFNKRPYQVGMRVFCSCLTGDTKVPLLDGRVLTMKQLVEEFGVGGKTFWVYSVDGNGDFKPGEAVNLGVTKMVNSIFVVTLDNGEEIRCTGDHKFMMRDGSYRESKDLVVGDSLMPLYFKTGNIKGKSTTRKYRKVLRNSDGRWEFVFRKVAEELDDLGRSRAVDRSGEESVVVHHKDFNVENNDPSNLEWMGHMEHYLFHSRLGRGSNKKCNIFKEMWDSNRGVMLDHVSKNGKRAFLNEENRKKMAENRAKGIKWVKAHAGTGVIGNLVKDYYKNLTDEEREQLSDKYRKAVVTEDRMRKLCCSSANKTNFERPKSYDVNKSKALIFKNNSDETVRTKQLIGKVMKRCWLMDKDGIEITKENFDGYKVKGYPGWDCLFGSFDRVLFYWDKNRIRTFNKYKPMFSADMNACLQEVGVKNHKVISVAEVKLDDPIPVYDLNVRKYENFLLNAGVVVHNCPAFLYWGSKYISTDEDYHLPEHDEDRPPDIRDPGRINWLCKHVVSLRYKTLYTIRMKQLIDRYAKIPKHHLEKPEEMHGDKYLKEKIFKDKKGKQSSVLVGGSVVMSFDEFALVHTMNDMDMVEVDSVNPIANEFSQRMNLGIDVDLTESDFEDQLDEIGMLVKE